MDGGLPPRFDNRQRPPAAALPGTLTFIPRRRVPNAASPCASSCRPSRVTRGAPLIIHVTGGVQAGSAGGRPEFVGLGFVEIFFAFPVAASARNAAVARTISAVPTAIARSLMSSFSPPAGLQTSRTKDY